jgi:hypothetical protein
MKLSRTLLIIIQLSLFVSIITNTAGSRGFLTRLKCCSKDDDDNSIEDAPPLPPLPPQESIGYIINKNRQHFPVEQFVEPFVKLVRKIMSGEKIDCKDFKTNRLDVPTVRSQATPINKQKPQIPEHKLQNEKKRQTTNTHNKPQNQNKLQKKSQQNTRNKPQNKQLKINNEQIQRESQIEEVKKKNNRFGNALFESNHNMPLPKFVKLVVEDIKSGDYYVRDDIIKGIQTPTLIMALVYINRCRNAGLVLTETNIHK